MKETESLLEARRELQEAFEAWTGEHGLVWFDTDVRLAIAIADELQIELKWPDGAVRV